jgi:hypothetical protein
MCKICLRSPCHPHCPNAAEPPRVFICSGCGGDILEGDNYWDIMGEQWCEECIHEAKRVAECEDGYDDLD